jgi:hypothetical protein
MKYSVVFDVAERGYATWWLPAVGFLLVACAATALLVPENLSRKVKVGRSLLLAFALAWTTMSLVATLGGHARLARALNAGRCEIAEGEVTDFHPMPYGGHEEESFVVAGRHFHYSDYVVTPGFRRSLSHNGPIHAGAQVRIHHLGNDIARLEIAY